MEEPPELYQIMVRGRKIHDKHGDRAAGINLENFAEFSKGVEVSEKDWHECWFVERLQRLYAEKGHVHRADLGDLGVSEEVVCYWLSFFSCLSNKAEKITKKAGP